MQNYLQYSRHKRKRIFFRPVFLTFVAAILILVTLVTVKLATENDKGDSTFSVGMQGAKAYTIYSQNKNGDIYDDVKMNNVSDENAKAYTSDAKKLTLDSDGNVTVRVLTEKEGIQKMPLEEYVSGCVLGEIPLSFEAEAVMAQCIAIRSFTVSRLLSEKKRHDGADVCTNPACCQSYVSPKEKNLSQEQKQKLYDALTATRSVVAVYDGLPIEAAYHASSGYHTENSKDVWGGDVPYLKSVSAPEGEAEICMQKYTFTYEEFSSLLSNVCGKSISCGAFGNGIECESDEYNLAEKITANTGYSLDKNTLRRALGLATKNFKIKFCKDSVNITCYGLGHGVGMSQHGANLLAKEGKSAFDIIKYYYSGVSLAFLT